MPKSFSLTDVAKRLRVSDRTIERLVKQGAIRAKGSRIAATELARVLRDGARPSAVVPPELVDLRSLPIDQRAEALIGMFRFVASEWAIMVLEHVKKPKTRRRVRAELARHRGTKRKR